MAKLLGIMWANTQNRFLACPRTRCGSRSWGKASSPLQVCRGICFSCSNKWPEDGLRTQPKTQSRKLASTKLASQSLIRQLTYNKPVRKRILRLWQYLRHMAHNATRTVRMESATKRNYRNNLLQPHSAHFRKLRGRRKASLTTWKATRYVTACSSSDELCQKFSVRLPSPAFFRLLHLLADHVSRSSISLSLPKV